KDLMQDMKRHAAWDVLLSRYVTPNGEVDYEGLKDNQTALTTYLEYLSAHPPEAGENKERELSYWINTYNAHTIALIVNNYPLHSIRDLYGGKPWDEKWIKINSRIYSLNDIEHGIIRKRFRDPRIHFAVNCAAKSCPPLANKAFTASNYEQLINQLTTTFINNPKYNQVESDQANLSKIFEWYADDFGDLISYVNRYSNIKLKPDAAISYDDYDWSLNGR
ncbi:MAG: DUF547 domain-containing protein, partial [Saprospiraceae bacterium]|nr:DUF547 domain-containing protein [Saprospiraceae bacterium]